MKNRQYMLMIMDGVGINEEEKGNAFKQANTPNLDRLFLKYPNTHIQTSGMAVGLPDGQMGNSEVGHTNIGAGRIVYQELTRITKQIDDGEFYQNEELKAAMDHVKENGSKLHLLGLVSDGGVHSHNKHLYALLEMAKREGIEDVFVHAILDGRDTPPTSAVDYIKELEEKMRELDCGRIATISGRYYAMDRDNRWERVKLAYDAIANGKGEEYRIAQKAIETSYEAQEFDEFVKPVVITNAEDEAIGKVEDGDSVIYFNFRPDRARELTKAFKLDEFDGFERNTYNDLFFVTMTQYDETIKNVHVAYKPQTLVNTFGEYISNKGYTQLRIAETEKYAHVTFFFNGGKEEPYEGEQRILIPSPKVATYDVKPEMSAYEVTDSILKVIDEKSCDVIIVNYANGDMVGHTGVIPAAIKAVETVDTCVGRFVEALKSVGGEVIIIADHGNADMMVDPETGEPFTAHTTNPVPVIAVSDRVKSIHEGALCDVAPTLLTLAGIDIPSEMTGKPLVEMK